MDRDQQTRIFGFIGGLALALLICIVAHLALSAESMGINVAVIVAAFVSLCGLAYVSKVSPDYNVGGKVVVGVIAGILTTFVMFWFMSWAWAGVFIVTQVFVYAGAIVNDIRR